MTTRLKVLAKLDIAERRKPQDGRISLSAAARRTPARHPRRDAADGRGRVGRRCACSTSRSEAPTLEELGLSDDDARRSSRADHRDSRRARCSSPARPAPASRRRSTGARPRSTARRSTSSPSRIRSSTGLPGVNQVQINPRAGLTFATALRSILRSDPDVIMVGEIRDGETAQISIEAALTGHFVLSTLHTNDAPGALTRLNEMGVEPFLTGAAVIGRARAAARAEALPALLASRTTPTDERARRGALHAGASTAASGTPLLPQGRLHPLLRRPATGAGSASSSSWSMNDELEQPRRRRATRDETRGAALAERHALALGRRPHKVLAGSRRSKSSPASLI